MKPATAPSDRLADLSIAEKRALLARLVREEGDRTGRTFPMSFSQQRLWFLDRLTPGNPFYNVESAQPIDGPLDVEALEYAINQIVQRHAVLRTTFAEVDEQPVQVVAPEVRIPLPVVDLTGIPAATRDVEVERRLTESARQPFDLGTGPLIRTELIRTAPARHVFVLSMHHIVADGWSMGLFAREMSELYAARVEGRSANLPELPIQYGDYSVWQRAHLSGERLEAQLAYWRRQLQGAANLDLVTDRPRPALQTFRGAFHGIRIPLDVVNAARALGQSEGCTLFMVLLATFDLLLHRHSGQDDIVVGTYIAGRTRAEIENLIGFFLNTLVLRTSLGGAGSFRELLGRVRETALEAYAHQDLPFERLVEDVHPPRDLSRNPVFQVTFQLNNAPTQGPIENPDATSTGRRGSAIFDIAFMLFETTQGLSGQFEYSTDLFDAGTIEAMGRQYIALLGAAIAEPDRPLRSLSLMSDAERQRTVVAWNDTDTAALPPESLVDLFRDEVDRRASEDAFRCDGEALTYGDLDTRSSRLAQVLRSRGVDSGDVVAVCVERSLDLPVAILAVVKAGAAWLPLDPGYPTERLAYMLEDSGARVTVTTRALRGVLPASGVEAVSLDGDREEIDRASSETPALHIAPDDLAYVIYTSGSTGTPKGVAGTHRQILNRLYWMWDAYPFEEDEVACMKTALGFVDSIWELFGALLCGIPTVILPSEVVRDPYAFVGALAESKTTRLWFVPSLLRSLLDTFPDLADRLPLLTFWVSSGEPLSTQLARRFRETLPDATLYNLYGTSEVWDATWHEVEDADLERTTVPIGRPIDNVQVYGVDEDLAPLPVGVPGELVVAGHGLPRGYVGAAASTGDRFITLPWGGVRAYRTGDACRLRADGAMELLGRIDHQVKIRGFRVEPAEIEAALERHPGVARAAVTVRDLGDGELALAAWFIAEGDEVLGRRALRTFLSGILPDFMIPASFSVIQEMPHTPSGKLDRRALGPLRSVEMPAAERYVAPRGDLETGLAEVWAALLAQPRVGAEDHFFNDLGGHSLLATQLIARIRSRFGVDVPLRSIFESPTVRLLAGQLRSRGVGVGAATNGDGRPVADDRAPLVRLDPAVEAPLSFQQQRLWFLDRLSPGNPFLNLEAVFPVDGPLYLTAMERTFAELTDRHEILRTVFVERDGEPFQLRLDHVRIEVPIVDVTALAPAERAGEERRLLRELAREPFDLERGPLLRVLAIRTAPERHLLAVCLHHIVADGWSMGILFRELLALYTARCLGTAPDLGALPVQYADFAAWQRRVARDGGLDGDLSFWRETLAGITPLDLPGDRPRPAVQSYRGGHLTFLLPSELKDDLVRLGREEECTLFMTLLTAFALEIGRWADRDDVVVGTFVANRPRVELEGLVGMFLNTLPLRLRLDEEGTFAELLRRTREHVLAAFEHQALPFERLVEDLALPRDLSRNPVFQVAFQLNTAQQGDDDVLQSLEERRGTSTMDLSLMLVDSPRGLAGQLEFSSDLFNPETMEGFAHRFEALLRTVVEAPDLPLRALPRVPEDVRDSLDERLTGPTLERDWDATLVGMFRAQALRTPDAPALLADEGSLTFRELDRQSDGVARALVDAGMASGGIVALHAQRSVAALVGLLGIVKAGGTWLRVDPEQPPARRRNLMHTADACVILSDRAIPDDLPDGRAVLLLEALLQGARLQDLRLQDDGETGALDVIVGPDELADLIPTSGSTEDPSGSTETSELAAVPWRQVLNRLYWMWDAHPFATGEVSCQTTDPGVAGTLGEAFGSLLRGIPMAVVSDAAVRDPFALVAALARHRVSRIRLSPTLLGVLLESFPDLARRLPDLTFWVSSGEPLHRDVVDRFTRTLPEARLFQVYGSPVVGDVAWCEVGAEDVDRGRIPIGLPIDNVRLHVVDRYGRSVPSGVPGELCAAGAGLATGFVDDPEPTRGRFVQVGKGGRAEGAYRTGDRVVLGPYGLEFLGRMDDGSVWRAGEDRARPTSGGRGTLAPSEAFVAPRTPTEERLVAIWTELLDAERVGVHDNFFEIGGHSLNATRLVSRIRAAFAVDLSLEDVFRTPTVEGLATRLTVRG